MRKPHLACALLLSVLLMLPAGCGLGSGGRTREGARPAPRFKPGFNLFSEQQDIQLGQQSSREMERQLPLLQDPETVNYIRLLGSKLTAKAPGYRFPYEFDVVATRELNAFALPGGPIYVNAGTILAARNEGELASVIAHEISHVALRHGTNQASKAYLAQAGLGVLGAVAGGSDSDLGQIINAVGGAGANAVFLKFSRTAEREADLQGARIMADAGYDPRDMASFFQTMAAQGGQRVPEFLSDHPDPGNRAQSILEIIPSLGVSPSPTRTTPQFENIKRRLGGHAGQLSATDNLEMHGTREPAPSPARPAPPAPTYIDFQARDGSFALQYPENWDGLIGDDSNMIFAPRGAYGEVEQGVLVTHGIFIGAVAPQADELGAATVRFIRQQIEANPDFRVARQPEAIDSNGRRWVATVVEGPSAVTGVMELNVIYTTATSDGRLFYLITIAPEDEFDTYKPAFERIIGSLQVR